MTEEIEPRGDRPDQTASAERAVAMLTKVISLMGYEVTVQLVREKGDAWLEVTSPEASRLIGREGQTLEALQLLLRRMSKRGNPGAPAYVIDVGDYRRRQLRGLRLTAKDAADAVRNSGRPLTLEPMSAPERKVIHQALRGDKEVETMSMAPERDGLKCVVVRPIRAADEDVTETAPSEQA